MAGINILLQCDICEGKAEGSNPGPVYKSVNLCGLELQWRGFFVLGHHDSVTIVPQAQNCDGIRTAYLTCICDIVGLPYSLETIY